MATEIPGSAGELVIYPGKEGRLRVQARLHDDTLWLTQKQMAGLFGVQPPAISKHLKNIFESNELQEEVVVSILENTTGHGAVKRSDADVKAVAEYDRFNKQQRIESDFDREVKKLLHNKDK